MNNVDKATFFAIPMKLRLQRRIHRQGQTLVEYALILAMISLVAIGVMISVGQQVKTLYSTIGSAVSATQASH